MVRLDPLGLFSDRDVPRGPDEAAQLPEAEAQGLVLVVEGLRAATRLLDDDPHGLAGRRRDSLVDHDLLGDELGELRPIAFGVGHRRLDEDLVPRSGDARSQRREDVREVLDVARADEDEIARNHVHLHTRPGALRIPAGDREALLLHRRQDEALQVPELRQLVDEQDALMGFVDRARHDAVIRLRSELRVPSVRIVPDVAEELRLARPRREDERTSGDGHEDLARALFLHLASLLERFLVEHADHVARPLVDDDLLLAELLPRRRDAVPAAHLRERHLEDAAEQIAERIPDVALGGGFRPAALRTHPVRRRGVRAAVDALVSEPLRDVDWRLLRIDQVAFRAREAGALRHDLVPLFDLDERPLRVLRVVDDADLLRDGREVEGERLSDHRLARPGRADEEEVTSLIRRDPGQGDRLVLADDPLQRIVRDQDLRRALEIVEAESLIRREQLRPRDTLHPGTYGARSLRVQTSTPVGCFVIVPIFVPMTECMFISAAMSRIRCVMMPSNTTARVCFFVFSVSTSSRTGTSVTTRSESSSNRAVDDPPSWTSMSRYFSSFGFRAFVVGERGAGARSSRSAGASMGRASIGRGSTGRGSARPSPRPGAPPAGRASGNSDSGLYRSPERPYISTYWSAGILFRRHFMICFCVSSSTSLPRGARAMKSTSATCSSSFRIRSPPRSPSTKAVSARSFESSWIVFGTFMPSTAIAFLMPERRRFRTSWRPSTMMIASLSATFGPEGRRSGPNETISETWTLILTSSKRSVPDVFDSSTIWLSSDRARSMILLRFVTRTSSTLSTRIEALHGPTRSIVSSAAAKIDVSTWSSEDGMRIVPSLRPFLLCTSTSMRPMRPLFCRSRRSSSSPSSPSVWPKTAPTTSGFSTIPSASIRAWIRYFVVLGSMFMLARSGCGPRSRFTSRYPDNSRPRRAPQPPIPGRQERMIRMRGIGESRRKPLSRVPNWRRAYLRVRAMILTFGTVGGCRAAGRGPRTTVSRAAVDCRGSRVPRPARRTRGAIRRP